MWSSFRCRRLDRAVAVLFSFILVGCAARPGPEVLTPVAASSGEKTLQIYVATTREREISSGNVFTANSANALNFATRQCRNADRNPRSTEQLCCSGSGRDERSRFSQSRRSARRYSAKKAQSLRFRARV